MIHSSDPKYVEHNRKLREADAIGKTQHLTNPSDQDVRLADFSDMMEDVFPELKVLDTSRSDKIKAFESHFGYSPLKEKDRFIEEFGFTPEQYLWT